MDEKIISSLIKALSSKDEPVVAYTRLIDDQWPFLRGLIGDNNLTHLVQSILEVRI